MRAQQALHLAAAVITVLAATGVSAQEAIPETPPELRDFRLDPERTQPQPETQPTIVTPPAAVPTVPETTPVRPATRLKPAPSPRPQSATAVTATDDLQTDKVDNQSRPETPASQPASEQTAPMIDDAKTSPSSADADSADSTWLLAVVGMGVGAMTLLAFVVWKRRRREMALEAAPSAPVAQAQFVDPAPVIISPPAPPMFAPPPPNTPLVTLNFVPEKATVSFTSLTVRGQLQMSNEGDATAKDMQLRAGLMSASADQDRVIEAFHQNEASIQPQQLGEVQPGERIGMAIELSVPLTELQSFPLGHQQLLVPIVVANLSYSDGVMPAERAYIACIIGREASPPQPKMGPLRLDLGPRSFAPLGQRPVVA